MYEFVLCADKKLKTSLIKKPEINLQKIPLKMHIRSLYYKKREDFVT